MSYKDIAAPFFVTRKLCEPKVSVRVARVSKTEGIEFAHDILRSITPKIVRWFQSQYTIEFQFIDKDYSLLLSSFTESEFSPSSSTDNLASSSSIVGMVPSTFSG